jgi:hypothetical protein
VSLVDRERGLEAARAGVEVWPEQRGSRTSLACWAPAKLSRRRRRCRRTARARSSHVGPQQAEADARLPTLLIPVHGLAIWIQVYAFGTPFVRQHAR